MTGRKEYPTASSVYHWGLVDFYALVVFGLLLLLHVSWGTVRLLTWGPTMVLVVSVGITLSAMMWHHLYTEADMYTILLLEVGLTGALLWFIL